MNNPKILSVSPVEDKKLIVKFQNGTEKMYDCKPLIEKYNEPGPLLVLLIGATGAFSRYRGRNRPRSA